MMQVPFLGIIELVENTTQLYDADADPFEQKSKYTSTLTLEKKNELVLYWVKTSVLYFT